MRADDPRHGTTSGYMAGCRATCCRRARAKHENMRRLAASRGTPYTVNSIGSIRRVQALMRIGWRGIDIAHACGWKTGEAVTNALVHRDFVNHRTAARIKAAYDQMSMTLGPSATTRRRAETRGWPPPLAWDDETIDDPAAKPQGMTPRYEPAFLDEAAIERRVNGDRSVRLHKGEAAEVVRRLLAAGVSTLTISRDYGIKAERYTQREQVKAA